MIIDKIKNYLNTRSDITYEVNKPVLDTCNINSIVDRYHIKVKTPVKADMQLHNLFSVTELAESFYEDLIKHPGFEDYKFEEPRKEISGFSRPKIIYKNDQKDTDITIKINGYEIKKKGLYHKVIELEFF